MFLSKSMHFSCARALPICHGSVLYKLHKPVGSGSTVALRKGTDDLSVLAIRSHQANLNKTRKQMQKKRTKQANKTQRSLVFSLSVFSSMLPVSFHHSIPHTWSSFLQRQVIHFTRTRWCIFIPLIAPVPSQSHQVSLQDSDHSPHLPSTPFHQRHVFVKLPTKNEHLTRNHENIHMIHMIHMIHTFLTGKRHFLTLNLDIRRSYRHQLPTRPKRLWSFRPVVSTSQFSFRRFDVCCNAIASPWGRGIWNL